MEAMTIGNTFEELFSDDTWVQEQQKGWTKEDKEKRTGIMNTFFDSQR